MKHIHALIIISAFTINSCDKQEFQKNNAAENTKSFDASTAPLGGIQRVQGTLPFDHELSKAILETDADPNRKAHMLQYNEMRVDASVDAIGDYRSFYGLTKLTGDHKVKKAVGGSYYLEDHGNGDIGTAFGGTSQYLAMAPGLTENSAGLLSSVRHISSDAQIFSARGAANYAWSIAPSGKAFEYAYGTATTILNEGGADFTNAYAHDSHVFNSGTGHIKNAVAQNSVIDNNSTIGTATGYSTELINNGEIENWYGLAIWPTTGAQPSKTSFAIASLNKSPSYVIGPIAFGTSTSESAQVVIAGEQDKPALAITSGASALSFSSSMVDKDRSCVRILIDNSPACLNFTQDSVEK